MGARERPAGPQPAAPTRRAPAARPGPAAARAGASGQEGQPARRAPAGTQAESAGAVAGTGGAAPGGRAGSGGSGIASGGAGGGPPSSADCSSAGAVITFPAVAQRREEPALHGDRQRHVAARREADQVLARDAGALRLLRRGDRVHGNDRGHAEPEFLVLHGQSQESKDCRDEERQHHHVQQRPQLPDPAVRLERAAVHSHRRRKKRTRPTG